jgi:hypothetical protein
VSIYFIYFPLLFSLRFFIDVNGDLGSILIPWQTQAKKRREQDRNEVLDSVAMPRPVWRSSSPPARMKSLTIFLGSFFFLSFIVILVTLFAQLHHQDDLVPRGTRESR